MKSMINVGAEITKDSLEGLAEAISKLMRVGSECQMEQKTIRHAISRLSMSAKVDGITLTHCNLTNNASEESEVAGCEIDTGKNGIQF